MIPDSRIYKSKILVREHLEKIVEAYDKNLKNEFDIGVKEIKNLINLGH